MNDTFNNLYNKLMHVISESSNLRIINLRNKNYKPLAELIDNEEWTVKYYADKYFYNWGSELSNEKILEYAKYITKKLQDYIKTKIASGEIDEYIHRDTDYPNHTFYGKYININKQNPQNWKVIYEHPHEYDPNYYKLSKWDESEMFQSKIDFSHLYPLAFKKIEKDFESQIQKKWYELHKASEPRREAERKKREAEQEEQKRKAREKYTKIDDFIKSHYYELLHLMYENQLAATFEPDEKVIKILNTLSKEDQHLFYDYVKNYVSKYGYYNPYLQYYDGSDYYTERARQRTESIQRQNLVRHLEKILNIEK